MQYSNWSNAIKYLVYATQLNAELGTVHMLLAECYMQTNNADKAIKETLLALNSLDLLSTEKRYCAIRVAKWLSQNNRTQDAELVLRDLIKRFPTFEEAKILISHLAQ
jgi:thioredoxin-like negative regulator of GroEL